MENDSLYEIEKTGNPCPCIQVLPVFCILITSLSLSISSPVPGQNGFS